MALSGPRQLNLVIRATDAATATLERVERAVSRVGRSAKRAGSEVQQGWNQLTASLAQITGLDARLAPVLAHMKTLTTAIQKITSAGLGQMFALATAGMVTFGAALVAGAGYALLIQRRLAAMADEIRELTQASRQFGIPIDQLSRMRYAAEQADASFQGVLVGARKLAGQLAAAVRGNDEAASSFKRIGLDAGTVRQLFKGDLLAAVQTVGGRIAGMKEQGARAAAGFALLGKGAKDVLAVVQEGDFKELGDELERYGAVITPEIANRLKAMGDATTRVQTATKGLVLEADRVIGVSTRWTRVQNALAEAFAQFRQSRFYAAFNDIAASALTTLGAIVQLVGEVAGMPVVLGLATVGLRTLAGVMRVVAYLANAAAAAVILLTTDLDQLPEAVERLKKIWATMETLRTGSFGDAFEAMGVGAEAAGAGLTTLGEDADVSTKKLERMRQAIADLARETANVRLEIPVKRETLELLELFNRGRGQVTAGGKTAGGMLEDVLAAGERAQRELALFAEVEQKYQALLKTGVGAAEAREAADAFGRAKFEVLGLDEALKQAQDRARYWASTWRDMQDELAVLSGAITEDELGIRKAVDRARDANITDPADLARVEAAARRIAQLKKEAGSWFSVTGAAEKAIDDISEALVAGTLDWKKVVQSIEVDFAHSFFTAFKEGIKHKLGFDRDFSVNIAGLMKNAGEVIAGNRGLGSIFEGVFKDSATAAAQGSQAIAASTATVPATAVQAAQTGAQALAAVGDQAVQTAATVSQAGTLAQGGWAGFFSFLLSSGQSAFGGLMQMAQAFLSMLTGSGSGGAGILNAIGSLAGLATGGRAGGSGGGWLDMISTGLGLAGGLWSGAKTLFGGTGIGTWLEGIAGSGIGQSVGQLFGLASSGAGLVSGIMGLANGDGNWLGNVLNTVQVLSGLTGVIGNVSQLTGFGAVPLSQGGIALMQGGQVGGILGVNGITTIEGGASLAQVGTQGGLFSLAQSGLSALGSSPMVQAVVQTFQSALGPIFEAVKAIVTTVTSVVAPVVAPTAAAVAGAAAPTAAAAAGGAAASVAPALGVLGGLAGMALGIKGAIEAPTTQGKVGNSLIAAGGLVAIVVPVLGIIIAIIGAILAATQNIDIRQMTRKEYGKQLSRVMGRWVDTNLYHQVGEGVRDKAALGRMREHRPEFVIAGLMGMGAMGAASMNRPDMSLEFTRMMMNNAAIAGYSEEQLAKLFRRNVIHFGGSLYGGVGLGGEALKSWRRQYGRPDADRMAVLTEGWRRTGNLFSENAAGVMVGDIFARHIAPSGRVDLKGAAVEIRRAVLQAIEMGAEFTRRDAKRLGDPFLRAFLQMVKKLPSVIDVLKLAQAVVASDTPGSARAMIRRLKRVVGYETALVAAGLELPADVLAEAAEDVPGRGRKQKRNVRARTATLVSLARLETARQDALLAIQYGPEAAQVAASDRELKAAQLAAEQANKTLGKKHVGKKKQKQAQDDLDQATQQANQAADSWRQAVTGILNNLVQLDAKLRESSLAFAEEIAQLRDQKVATSVYTAALADNAARMAKATTAATKAGLIEERMALLRRQAQADLANLQRDLDQVAPMAQLAAGIKGQIADIQNAGRSPRALLGDVQDQLARAQNTFRTAKDGSERAAAAQEIQQLVARSMELAGDAFGGSSGRARAVRDAGLAALGEIGVAAQLAADEAKRLQDQMKTVNQVLADRLELEQTALVSAMKAMRADLVAQLQAALPGTNIDDLLADPIAAQTVILAESDKKLAEIRDILATRAGVANGGAQAAGGDYLVTRPTIFLAGEAGPERATFTPMRGGRRVATGGDVAIQITANVTVAPAAGEKPARALLYGRTAANALSAEIMEQVNHGELGRRLRGVM